MGTRRNFMSSRSSCDSPSVSLADVVEDAGPVDKEGVSLLGFCGLLQVDSDIVQLYI